MPDTVSEIRYTPFANHFDMNKRERRKRILKILFVSKCLVDGVSYGPYDMPHNAEPLVMVHYFKYESHPLAPSSVEKG